MTTDSSNSEQQESPCERVTYHPPSVENYGSLSRITQEGSNEQGEPDPDGRRRRRRR